MKIQQPYRDRREAGEVLARALRENLGAPGDLVVLALPRGGVPVAFEVARELRAELDVFVVRKLGVPGQEEYAMGAIAAGGFKVINQAVIAEIGITQKQVAEIADKEAQELRRRERAFRDDRPPAELTNRLVVLVDDGLATGFTMRAAVAAVRDRRPRLLVVAVPVGAPDTCRELAQEVNLLVCPFQPEPFRAVGLWYKDFEQTSDDEVRVLLSASIKSGRPAVSTRSSRSSS